jgi:iron complex outermembrane receptor protein
VNDNLNAAFGMTRENGLRPPTPFPADGNISASAGAFSVCDVLETAAAATGGAIDVLDGIGVSLKGNELPQAPVAKFSAGVQKTFEFDNGWTLTPRADVIYTGESYGNIFNGRVNRIQGYEQVNMQVQLDGPDGRWFVRGFVQNLLDNNAITGQYLTDASSGLFTNIFTLEPRRYGIAAGVKF